MTVRRCLGCQTPTSVAELIPLHLSGAGSVRVGTASAGRGGWIHPACIQTALDRPSLLNRSFRCRVTEIDDLNARAIDWIRNQIKRHYTRALHDGLVVKKSTLAHDDPSFDRREIVAPNDDCGTFLITETSGLTYTFELEKPDMDAIVGDRSPGVLHIKPGRSTQSLLRSLRAWDKLG